MKENKYDDEAFFAQYSQMERSTKGLEGAGEWHALRGMLPDLRGKRVLDLGCGFGWHCRYAAEQGAASVIGTDISAKMLEKAREMTAAPNVSYEQVAIEDIAYPDGSFDVIISSLALHYIASFDAVCKTVARLLSAGGAFVFSVEHPIFTAQGKQDWVDGPDGTHLFWPVDRYFEEGVRHAVFLGEAVTKYHHTMTTFLQSLLQNGFMLTGFIEPEPDPVLLAQHPEYMDELRRPMFALFSAQKA